MAPIIHLDPWADTDLPLLRRLLGDPAMMEHLGGPETEEQIVARQARYMASADPVFRITDEATGEGIGWVGYWELRWNGHDVFETGWSVVPGHQGRGVAAAAAALVVAHARRDGRHPHLHAFPGVGNPASNAICRKLGFTLLGPCEFERPPGVFSTSNDWRLDLRAT